MNNKIKFLSIEKVLFVVVFALGLIWTFLIPPFQKPDENTHYFRAVSIAKGEFVCATGDNKEAFEIGSKYLEFNNQQKTSQIAFNYEEKTSFSEIFHHNNSSDENNGKFYFMGFCGLEPFSYFLFIIPILIGDLVNSLLVGFFLCRLFAFLLFFICSLWSYKKIKESRFKWVLILFALTPMVTHQASAIGYDYLLLSVVPILFSFNIRFLIDKKILRKDLFIYLILILVLLLAKPGYYALSLLVLLIPREKIGIEKKKYFILIVFSFILYVLASYLSFSIFRKTGDSTGSLPIDILPSVLSIRHVLVVIKNTLVANTDFYVKSFIGVFGWLDYSLSPIFYYIYIFVGIILSKYLSKDEIYKKVNKKLLLLLFILFISFAIIFALFYMLYLVDSKNIISGVQGRYFLVFFPYLLLLMGGFIRLLSENKKLRIVCIAILIFYVFFEILYSLFRRYYM